MSIEFRYKITGRGWSECTLRVNGSHVTVTASYLSDALRSFLSAMCRVLDGLPDSTARFCEEPGEYRWRFFRVDDDAIRIVILEFEDFWTCSPDDNGRPIFDIQCRLRSFAGAVYDDCRRLLGELGRDGYEDMWVEHDFPDSEFIELAQLLGAKVI